VTPLSVEEAVAEAPRTVATLLAWADAPPANPGVVQWRHEVPASGTYAYQTRAVAIAGDRVLEIATAALTGDDEQPWFSGFRGRVGRDLDGPLPAGIVAARVVRTRFDLGFGRDRIYDQLVCLARPDAATRVVTQRSVRGEPLAGTVPAFTLAPSGDVLRRRGEWLVWDHAITAPGGALLPPEADRRLTNLVRWLGLDGTERRAYLAEAEAWRAWAEGLARKAPPPTPT
jgi:hypothetical protein